MGETIDFPVTVHNWSDVAQSGTVSLTLPANFSSAAGVEAVRADRARRRRDGLELVHSSTQPPATRRSPASQQSHSRRSRITTTNSTRGAAASRTVSCRSLPKTTIPQAPAAPTLDGVESAGEYAGDAARHRPHLGGRRLRTPARRSDCGIDCGSSSAPGTANSTYARVACAATTRCTSSSSVRDDFQSYAVTPAECVGHWLADSVEILIDPRGRASDNAMDTANTFKLGIFPFTNDPTEHERQRRQRPVLVA